MLFESKKKKRRKEIKIWEKEKKEQKKCKIPINLLIIFRKLNTQGEQNSHKYYKNKKIFQ